MAEMAGIYTTFNTPKERWKLLRSFVENKKLSVDHRQTHALGLFKSRKWTNSGVCDGHNESNDKDYEWMEYTSVDFPNCRALIRQRIRAVNWDDATGFDNTGNICVWPSEEILSYLCIKNHEDFRGKTVCELGAGMTGLAGMMMSIACDVKEVLITDGNIDGIRNLDLIAKVNKAGFGGTIVKNRVLKWDDKEDYLEHRDRFDYVICADCLLYEEKHGNLLDVMDTIIKPDGTVIVLSPRRGNAVEKFVNKAKDIFEIEETEKYDVHLWELYIQEKQISPFCEVVKNFPVLLKLKKIKTINQR